MGIGVILDRNRQRDQQNKKPRSSGQIPKPTGTWVRDRAENRDRESRGVVTTPGGIAFPTGDASSLDFPEVYPRFVPILAVPYVDPLARTGEVAEFNMEQYEKNLTRAREYALMLTDLEYEGLEAFNRRARKLQQEGIIDENEFNRLQITAANQYNIGEVSQANVFNQQERIAQLEEALPGARDTILRQIERGSELAEGRFPGELEDRAYEVAARNAAADMTQAGGFGVGSAFGEKTSDLLSAQQRLQLSQVGEQTLNTFLTQGANLAFDQPIKYNPVLQQPLQAQTSMDVRGAPSVPASTMAVEQQSMLTPLTTIQPGQAIQFDIGQNQFQANLTQQANMFNSNLDFNSQTFNAEGNWGEQIEKFMSDVFNAQQEANALNSQLEYERAMAEAAEAERRGRRSAGEQAAGAVAGAIVAGAADYYTSQQQKTPTTTEEAPAETAKQPTTTEGTTTTETTTYQPSYGSPENRPVEAAAIGGAGIQMVGAYNQHQAALAAGEAVSPEATAAFDTVMTSRDASALLHETLLSGSVETATLNQGQAAIDAYTTVGEITGDATLAQQAADTVAQGGSYTFEATETGTNLVFNDASGATTNTVDATEAYNTYQAGEGGTQAAQGSQAGEGFGVTFGTVMAVASILLGSYAMYQTLSTDMPGRPASRGAHQGAQAGAAIGGGIGAIAGTYVFPGVGTLAGWAAGTGYGAFIGSIIGAVHVMTGSSKGEGQIFRDNLRNYADDKLNLFFKADPNQPGQEGLQGGFHYIRLADGTLFNVGIDGGNKWQNVGVNIDGKEDRHTFEVDFSDPRAAESVSLLQPLAAILFGPEGGQMMMGHLWNAATSNNGSLSATKENFKYFADTVGVDYDTGLNILKRYASEGKISKQDFPIYADAWLRLMKVKGVEQDIVLKK